MSTSAVWSAIGSAKSASFSVLPLSTDAAALSVLSVLADCHAKLVTLLLCLSGLLAPPASTFSAKETLLFFSGDANETALPVPLVTVANGTDASLDKTASASATKQSVPRQRDGWCSGWIRPSSEIVHVRPSPGTRVSSLLLPEMKLTGVFTC